MTSWRQRLQHAADRPLDTLLTLIFLQWLPVVAGVFLYSYRSQAFTDVLSFGIEDAWCLPERTGFGPHCFGDFGLPFHAGTQPYATFDFAGSNPPLLYVFVAPLQNLPYRWALILYLTSAIVAMVASLWPVTRSLPTRDRTAVLVFGALLSGGFLSAIDRGNHIAFMAPLLIGLLLSKSSKVRVTCLTLLVGLKFWGILLLLVPLRRRQYREAALSLALAIYASSVAMFTLSDNWLNGVTNMFNVITDGNLSKEVTPYSISAIALIRRSACHVGPASLCSTQPSTLPVFLLALALLAAFLLIAWLAMGQQGWSEYVRYAPAVAMVPLGLPEAGSYVLVLVVALTALVAAGQGDDATPAIHRESNGLRLMTLIAIASTTAPIAFAVLDSVTGTMVRWQYLVSPIAWSVTVGWIACEMLQRRSRHHV